MYPPPLLLLKPRPLPPPPPLSSSSSSTSNRFTTLSIRSKATRPCARAANRSGNADSGARSRLKRAREAKTVEACSVPPVRLSVANVQSDTSVGASVTSSTFVALSNPSRRNAVRSSCLAEEISSSHKSIALCSARGSLLFGGSANRLSRALCVCAECCETRDVGTHSTQREATRSRTDGRRACRRGLRGGRG